MIGLDQTASVYTPDGTDGSYTVLATSSLQCRLTHNTTVQKEPAEERAEVAHQRRLLWDPDYTMPSNCEVLVAGQRWSVQPETIEAIRGANSAVVYNRATVVIVL